MFTLHELALIHDLASDELIEIDPDSEDVRSLRAIVAKINLRFGAVQAELDRPDHPLDGKQ